MSDNHGEFDRTAAEEARHDAAAPAGEEAGLEADAGQYVEGDYGNAGVTGENPAGAPEGEYAEGDYGKAGVATGSAVGAEEGDYPEGDYGKAGATGPDAVAGDEGEYEEGDYGAAGATGHRAAGEAPRLNEHRGSERRDDETGR